VKTLSEIKRNIIAFYSRIQSRVTDFSVGSVVHDMIFSVSAALEDVHRDIAEVEKQAYIATASGAYLDKLINGTFQLPRSPATRSMGYVVLYGESPLANPTSVKLRYANYNYDTGKFVSGVESSTKFIGFNNQGDEGVVFSLIQPRNEDAVLTPVNEGDTVEPLIDLGNRNVQYLILPVAAVLTGAKTNIIEGGITSFPSPPPGISNVLNTSNPGIIFFSSGQPVSSAPFYSRFTNLLGYNSGKLSVVNAYNFSPRGFVEIKQDVDGNPIVAIYSDMPIGTPGAVTKQAGLIFEYMSQDTSVITLKDAISNSPVPSITITDGGVVKTLYLRTFSYGGTDYDEGASYTTDIEQFVAGTSGLVVSQRPDQISDTVIFDPDGILTTDYKVPTSHMVAGGSDEDNDEEYRTYLRAYLSSLSKATPSALEAGALQISGITFAKTLTSDVSPRGTTILLVSNEDGVISPTKKNEVKRALDSSWKAAGVNLIVSSPELIKTHFSMVIKPSIGITTSTVMTQVSATLNSYLKTKNPGDSLKYSEVLSRVGTIPGIENIFNLIISKELTLDTYTIYKADYDLAALKTVATSYEEDITQAGTIADGTPVKLSGSDYVATTATDQDAVGIIHDSVPAGGGNTTYSILFGDAKILSSFYTSLMSAVTPEDFVSVSTINFGLVLTSLEFLYVSSYLFSEPLLGYPGLSYPIDPLTIQYQYISDYTSSATQLFRLGSVSLPDTTISPLVGIKFIT